MFGVLAQPRGVFHQLELFATGFAADGIVQVARFLADEEYGFGFFLALGHDRFFNNLNGKKLVRWATNCGQDEAQVAP